MGSPERIRNVAQARRQMGPRRAPDGRRAVGDERRDQPPARPGQGAVARVDDARAAARARHDRRRPASRSRSACWRSRLQAEGIAGGQLRRLAGADRDRRAYTKARIESIDDARVRADLAAGKVVVITGFQGVDARRPHHDARPRRLRHLGRGRRRGAEGRRVPDLHRRRRRLHHRPAHRPRGAPPAHASASRRCSRWRASAPRCCRSARSSSPASTACRCACCRASRPGTSTSTRKPRSGTLITFEEDEKMEQAVVSGIAFNRDEAKISLLGVPDKPGIAYQILGPGGRRQHRRRRDHPERLARRPDRLLVHRAPQRLRAHDGRC